MRKIKLTNLIFFTGKPRVGKDLAASYIKDKYGFAKYAFADAVKHAVSLTLNKSVEELEERKESHRPAYNRVGEGMKPLYGNSIWASITEPSVTASLGLGNNVVISDLGFNIEYFYLRNRVPPTTSIYVINIYNDETPQVTNDTRNKLTVKVDYRIKTRYSHGYTEKGERNLDLSHLYKELDSVMEDICCLITN